MFSRRPIALAACALVAAVGLVSGGAGAATAIRLQTEGDLPFTADELEQAVGARLAMSADPGAVLVAVGPADDAGVRVRMGDRQVVVAVGNHAGLAAARVVALAIAELAVDAPAEADAEAEEADAARPPPEVVAPAGAPAIAAAAPPVTPAPSGPATRISLALGGTKGMDDEAEPYTWAGEADIAFPTSHGYDLIGGLGVWDLPSRNVGRPDEVSFLSGVVRAGAGWRSGPALFMAGPFAAPYRIEGPTIHHTGLLVGGGGMVRIGHRFTVASNIEVFGALRVDVFANRVHVASTSPEPTFATPRLSTSFALGVGWDVGI